MKPLQLTRNICIGLIDGITIPLALAAGLTQLVPVSSTIVIACLAVAIAGSITMAAGGYMEAKKYEPSVHNLQSALLIGLSYLCGGLFVSLPFLFFETTQQALICTLIVSILLLLITGFIDSRINGAPGWAGALRVSITGILAATAAYFVSGMF